MTHSTKPFAVVIVLIGVFAAGGILLLAAGFVARQRTTHLAEQTEKVVPPHPPAPPPPPRESKKPVAELPLPAPAAQFRQEPADQGRERERIAPDQPEVREQPRTPDRRPPAEVYKEGDRVSLSLSGKAVTVGKSKPSLEAYQQAEASGDSEAAGKLTFEGKVFTVDAGTDAKVLEVGEGVYWVKILSGAHRDKLGYVAAEAVGREGWKK